MNLSAAPREELITAILRLRDENSYLKHQLNLLRRRLEQLQKKTPTDHPPPHFKPNAPETPPGERRKRIVNFGRKRDVPDRIVNHAYQRCPDCGAKLYGGWLKSRRQIIDLPLPAEITGGGLRVKGVEVLRDFFGLERGKNLSPRRLTGEIAADFLPLTAARDRVIQDSREYEAFRRVLDKHLKRIGRQLAKFKENRGDIKADKALSEALLKVRQALRLNKDFLFTHDLPLFTPEKGKNEVLQEAMAGIQAAKVGKKKEKENFKIGDMIKKAAAGIKRINRARVKTVLKDKKRLVKKLKIGGVNIVCSLTHLGNGEAERFSEGRGIY